MKNVSNIAHPLKNRTGLSQRKRVKPALRTESVPVDGKTLADRLRLIRSLAGHVRFYSYRKSPSGVEEMEPGHWSAFFDDSLPFRLAAFGKTSVGELEEQFLKLSGNLERDPSAETLEPLLDFMFLRLIEPVSDLFRTVEAAQNSLSTALLSIVKTSYSDPLQTFIRLHHAASTFLCVRKRDFTAFIKPPWQLKAGDVHALESSIRQVTKGKREAFAITSKELTDIFYLMYAGFGEIVEAAPGFIEESLIPLEESLQKKHQPHLALMFTFLEIFKQFQGNLNELSSKHLDFFYKNVLRMVPKEAVPDQVHIVFEIAKHLPEYPLPVGLLLKNGKDGNNQDILFGLDHGIIVDKARIEELRTLFHNQVDDGGGKSITEGIYIAPVANSMDGRGMSFPKELSPNWPTLGAKYSKFTGEDESQPAPYPPARLGFVLASPVLLLQEGKRKIQINLTCEFRDGGSSWLAGVNDMLNDEVKVYTIDKSFLDRCGVTLKKPEATAFIAGKLAQEGPFEFTVLEDFLDTKDPISCEEIFDDDEKKLLRRYLEEDVLRRCLEEDVKLEKQSLFRVWFSGEEEWIPADPEIKITWPDENSDDSSDYSKVKILLDVTLEPDIPAVTFYDEEALEEKLDLEKVYPVVKIELNEEFRINLNSISQQELDSCCLKRKPADVNQIDVTPYHYLKDLKLVDVNIEVEVCGVKNLIVQNDEGNLDINAQLFPFGLRPNVPGFDPMNQFDEYEKENGDSGENNGEDNEVNNEGEEENDKKNICPDDIADSSYGPSFYVGSKEILYKKWGCVRVNLEWKDKPDSFHDHYKAYIKHKKDLSSPPLEKNFGLDESKFNLCVRELNKGEWKSDKNPVKLFSETSKKFCDKLNCNRTFYGWEFHNTFTNRFVDFSQPLDSFKNSLDGFLKFTLKDQDFLHQEYPFVLARQMLAYANIESTGNKKLTDAIYIDNSSKTIISPINDFFVDADEFKVNLDIILGELNTIQTAIEETILFLNNNSAIRESVEDVRDEIEKIIVYINDYIDQLIPEILKDKPISELNEDVLNENVNINSLIGELSEIPNISGMIEFIISVGAKINKLLEGKAETALNELNNFIDEALEHLTPAGQNLNELIENIEGTIENLNELMETSNFLNFFFSTAYQALIPNEPWTPIIKNLYVDYTASAEKEDISLIHLYPFENTSKLEDLEENPGLLPYFSEEGTLFIGLEEVTPGGQLSMLFQLAEATADSEINRAQVEWYYLSGNRWSQLRPDREIVSDETDGLTVSGIVTINLPAEISKTGHTVMPEGLYWLRVSVSSNSRAVAETIGIHLQAAKTSARLSESNDTGRLDSPLEAGSISSLVESDFSVKAANQPYDSFDGRLPEASGHFYVRVSEHLRHKGRSVTIDDYEKIVLEGFPQVYKVKCISHTMGLSANEYRRDLEVSPGYSLVAVIPDLTQLKAGNELEPKIPRSLLEKIGRHLRARTSPFARISVMNPRYEYVDVAISVRLYPDKSDSFYSRKLKEDLTLFLAPWYLGGSEKMAFGQEIYYSDVVGFIEQLGYVDYIKDLVLSGECGQKGAVIKPLTARSVLTGGEICVKTIDVECHSCE